MNNCFLSYARADEGFALRLANDLGSLGVEMWVDQFHIRPSEHWDRAIERAIRASRNMVAVLSPRSVASENVADEISLAIDIGRPVIPVMIERCPLPLRLARRHLIDATAGYEVALKQCFAEIAAGPSISNLAPIVAKVAAATLDPDILAKAQNELTPIVGPIAEILVEKAARWAQSPEELYGLLAVHIHDKDERARFRATAVQPGPRTSATSPAQVDPRPIDPAVIDRIATALTAYLGPIASIITRRESRHARSIDDLLGRLTSRLPTDTDRTEFLGMLEMQGAPREAEAA